MDAAKSLTLRYVVQDRTTEVTEQDPQTGLKLHTYCTSVQKCMVDYSVGASRKDFARLRVRLGDGAWQ